MTETLHECIQETLLFIQRIGRQSHMQKCAILASSAVMRRKLKHMKWSTDGDPIPVTTDIRDLGSLFACGKRAATRTLKDRIAKAIPTARKIGAMWLTTQRKVRMLRTKTIPVALCGVESTFLPEESRRKLQTARSCRIHEQTQITSTCLIRIGPSRRGHKTEDIETKDQDHEKDNPK